MNILKTTFTITTQKLTILRDIIKKKIDVYRTRNRSRALVKKNILNADFVVLANAYPSQKKLYGGEFIRARVEAYVASRMSGCVIEINARNTKIEIERGRRLIILRLPVVRPEVIAKALSKGSSVILSHSPRPDLQDALNTHIREKRIVYWFHGFELRDYRRLYSNFTTEELEKKRNVLDELNFQRWDAARRSFKNENATVVFVSKFLKEESFIDIGTMPKNYQIIHNYIDTKFFKTQRRERRLTPAPRIMLLRPFHARNYATDIATKAISILSTRSGFEKIHFTIRGFGRFFEADTSILKGLKNVVIEDKYCTPTEMQQIFADHDIALTPTRYDTQGVSFGEAMASGLACITHHVAAKPEFADDSCAVLVKSDHPKAYAEAIWELAHNPDKTRRLGDAAAKRVHEQCGWSRTIQKEIDLIKSISGRKL